MKVGDLVQFSPRFSGKHGDKYLVISQVETWDRKGPSSPFSKWEICNTATGKTHVQSRRDLEVISESR
jgi:hypothetical protein